MVNMRALVLLLALAACGSYKQPKVGDAAIDTVDGFTLSYDLDVLFVIDNSASTYDKQTVFAASFPQFVAQLDALPAGRPNLHLGVVDSTVDIGVAGFGPGCPVPDPGDDGLLQNTPRVTGCLPPTGHFISDVLDSSGSRTTNYSGSLADAFACIAQVGATGCGFEAQLEAMKRALDGSRPENAGFIRPTASLAIVFLTDEDDCSAADNSIFMLGSAASGPGDFRCQPLFAYSCDQPISASAGGTYTNCHTRTGSYLQDPAYYYQFLTTLKDPSAITVAMIAGNPETTIMTGMLTTPFTQTLALLPSCTATINGNAAIARPGNRLADFLNRFGAHGLFYTACQGDYSSALADIGQHLTAIIAPHP